MALTAPQLVTLKADILADPTLSSQPENSDGAFAIAAAYNLSAAPPFVVWRTELREEEMMQKTVWTEYIIRSAGERDAYRFMLSAGTINAADPNVRQGIVDIFSGPGGATTRTQLTELAKRNATRAEKLFATGTGTTISPATMTFQGNLTFQDVLLARALP